MIANHASPVPACQELPLERPFRLDLTVSALRRLPTNVIDVFTPGGEYVHAFAGRRGPVIARVSQPRADALLVRMDGGRHAAADHAAILALIRRTLGLDRDVSPFVEATERISWFRPLAQRLRGLNPPRYRSLWEAFVNAIVFQQVSLHAASAIVRRLILAVGSPLESEGTRLYQFPGVERVLGEPDDSLRAMGLSAGKIGTLRRAGDAILSGTLDEATLEEQSSADAAILLRQIKGIGPWTATVILLRGLGRLDVFPMNDSGVMRNLTLVSGTASLDVSRVLDALGPQRGMLYYHLLLARLEARGEVGQPSVPAD